MSNQIAIDGTTRLIGIIGDPIGQVKAPTLLNPILAARGHNAVLVPFHVAPADLDAFVAGLRVTRNFDALVGSGGAGAAITAALIEAGAARVVVSDVAAGKAEALASRLGAVAGSPDPRGYDLVVNATPMGMRPDDPLPFDASALSPDQFVGEVITKPELSPLLRAASARGCRFSTGPQMVAAQAELIADFLTAHIG